MSRSFDDPVVRALAGHWSARLERPVYAAWPVLEVLRLVWLGHLALDLLAKRQAAFVWPLLERAAIDRARSGAAVSTSRGGVGHV